MKKYLLLYQTPASVMAKAMKKSSPEDHKKTMKEWYAWKKFCGNHLVDFGSPVMNGFGLTKNGGKASNKSLVGYAILKADNKTQAKKLLKNHPHLKWNGSCSIEVHEIMRM